VIQQALSLLLPVVMMIGIHESQDSHGDGIVLTVIEFIEKHE
jgi:hypothetical protein